MTMDLPTADTWFIILAFAIDSSSALYCLMCCGATTHRAVRRYFAMMNLADSRAYMELLSKEMWDRRKTSRKIWNDLGCRYFRSPMHQNRYFRRKQQAMASLGYRLVSPTLKYHQWINQECYVMSSAIVRHCLATRNHIDTLPVCWQFGQPWLPTIEALVRYGHPVDQVNPHTGETLLFRTSKTKVIDRLLDLGVPVNHRNHEHHTALWHLVVNRHFPAVKVMLRHGCDVTVDLFSRVGTAAMFRMLFRHRSYDAEEQRQIVVHMVRNAVDPNVWLRAMGIERPESFHLPNNETMLHQVRSRCSLNMLLRAAPSLRRCIDDPDASLGQTPLHRLVRRVLDGIVKPTEGLVMARIMRCSGASTTIEDATGTVPLETWVMHFRWGHWPGLQLRSKRAWIRLLARGNIGRPGLLHRVANCFQTVVMLVSLGADPGALDTEGHSILSQVHVPDTLARLLQRYPDSLGPHLSDPRLMFHAKNRMCGELLLTNGARINRRTFDAALCNPYRWWLVEATLDTFPDAQNQVVQCVRDAMTTRRDINVRYLLSSLPRLKRAACDAR